MPAVHVLEAFALGVEHVGQRGKCKGKLEPIEELEQSGYPARAS